MKTLLTSLLILGLNWAGYGQGYWKRVHGDGIESIPSPEGTYAPENSPWARYASACMADSSGNFWLYGGDGGNDLWCYNPNINQWMITNGDPDDADIEAVYGELGVPGPDVQPGAATFGHPSWGDHEGNLWLYGIGGLNDLWRYNIDADLWTWMKGTGEAALPVYGEKGVAAATNNPGVCNETDCHWTDSEGNLWLYTELDGNLWKFDTVLEMWIWVNGNGAASVAPEHGVLDVFDTDNTPGGFSACPAVGTLYTMWMTSDDHLWMLVNRFEADLQTEMWEFNPDIEQWRCRRIDVHEFGADQVFPDPCLTDDSTIYPIARTEMRAEWVDDCDRLYFSGGGNFCSISLAYNDVWYYNPETNNYTYLLGGTDPMVEGIQGVFDSANRPPAVVGSQAWQNTNGFYFMGGQGTGFETPSHSLWLFVPDTVVADFDFTTDCYTATFSNGSTTGCNEMKSISWDFGDGETSSEENPVHVFPGNGIYEVLLTVTNCSWHTDTITRWVMIDCPFNIELSPDTICEGECIELVVTGVDLSDDVSFVWEHDDLINDDTAVVCPIETTLYRVIATNGVGEVDSAEAVITVIPDFEVDLGPDTTVCGGELILEAPDISGAFYSWSTGEETSIITVAETGWYGVQVAVGSCQRFDSVFVTVNGPVVNLGPDTLVCHTGFTISVPELDGYSYLWQDGSSLPEMTVEDTGVYVVTVTDSDGCSVSDSLWVGAGIVAVSLGPDTVVCRFDDWLLDAGAGGLTYLWHDGNDERWYPVTDSGWYSVTVTDGLCSGEDSIWVGHTFLAPNFTVTDTIGCFPFQTHFTDLSVGEEITAWLWDFGDGTTAIAPNPSHVYASSGTYLVSLQITTVSGCTALFTRVIEVIVLPQPEALFSFSPDMPETNLEISFSDESIGATTWLWFFGDGTNTHVQHPVHTYEMPNNYTVTLVVDNHFCSDTIRRTIQINEELIFYVPNAFTPDGDQFNPVFLPVFTTGYDPYDYHLTIFNRWGQVVFESYNAAVGWDGTYARCGLVVDDVYVWQIEVGLKTTDERSVFRGHVTVLK